MCVCVHVSGCEVLPERRGRREGGARVGAGLSTTAMHVCMYVHVYLSIASFEASKIFSTRSSTEHNLTP